MQGIIHDYPDGGNCYFEPMFLVEINNRLQELKREEREEERKVLTYLRPADGRAAGARAAQDLLAPAGSAAGQRLLAQRSEARSLPLVPVEEGIQLLKPAILCWPCARPK